MDIDKNLLFLFKGEKKYGKFQGYKYVNPKNSCEFSLFLIEKSFKNIVREFDFRDATKENLKFLRLAPKDEYYYYDSFIKKDFGKWLEYNKNGIKYYRESVPFRLEVEEGDRSKAYIPQIHVLEVILEEGNIPTETDVKELYLSLNSVLLCYCVHYETKDGRKTTQHTKLFFLYPRYTGGFKIPTVKTTSMVDSICYDADINEDVLLRKKLIEFYRIIWNYTKTEHKEYYKSFIEDFINKLKGLGTDVDAEERAKKARKAEEKAAKKNLPSLYPFNTKKIVELVDGFGFAEKEYTKEADGKKTAWTNFKYLNEEFSERIYLFPLRFPDEHEINHLEYMHQHALPNVIRVCRLADYSIYRPNDSYITGFGTYYLKFSKVDADNLLFLSNLTPCPNVSIMHIDGQKNFGMLATVEKGKPAFIINISNKERGDILYKCLIPLKCGILPPDEKRTEYLKGLFKLGKELKSSADLEETDEEYKAINLRLARYAMKFWLGIDKSKAWEIL